MALNFRSTTEGIYDGEDNAQGIILYPHTQLELAYAATVTLPATICEETTYCVDTLTGAITINAAVAPFAGDKLLFLFKADGSNRTITFGTNMKSAGTLQITASKFGSAEFQFDGTNWIETGRTITT